MNTLSRSNQRENAFLVFYSNLFINGSEDTLTNRTEIKNILHSLKPDDIPDEFLFELLHLTAINSNEIKNKIQQCLKGWRIERLAKVDCSILMLGTTEFFYLTEKTPLAVLCNEYIELAKKYGHADSSNFVNATLEAISKA